MKTSLNSAQTAWTMWIETHAAEHVYGQTVRLYRHNIQKKDLEYQLKNITKHFTLKLSIQTKQLLNSSRLISMSLYPLIITILLSHMIWFRNCSTCPWNSVEHCVNGPRCISGKCCSAPLTALRENTDLHMPSQIQF